MLSTYGKSGSSKIAPFAKLFILLLTTFWLQGAVAKESSSLVKENATPVFSEQAFATWVAALESEGLDNGISANTLAEVLPQIKFLTRVIELDRNQPEFKLTSDQYLSRVISKHRINKGRKLLKEHNVLLSRIEKEFGVPPRFIVALWGMETGFGRMTGGFNAINALATLAYDGRRSAFFRKQLFKALKIIDQGHTTYKEMLGSWAGAMGQTQFMPSTFESYAIDFTGDGKIDLWSDKEDALASGANYLSQVGWVRGQTWGREVTLPSSFDAKLLGLSSSKKISEWQALGIRRVNGDDLPTREIDAYIIRLDKGKGRSYMVYENYLAIMDWNKSKNFATAVGLLSDKIGRITK